jgi:hypothetical protein
MTVRTAVLAASIATLMSSPAWATPGHAPSSEGNAHSHHGDAHPHRCQPHRVAYIASGLLVSQTLTLDDGSNPPPTTSTVAALHQDGGDTYSGDVTVDVKRTNHHAAADKGKAVTYTVSHVRVRFGMPDANGDGKVDLTDVQPGARVKLIGKVTKLARRCDQSAFTPETTIRQIVFHAPPQEAS